MEEATRAQRRWRVPACLGTVVILLLCFLPSKALPAQEVAGFDKIGHLLAFAAWAVAWRLASAPVRRVLVGGLLLVLATEGGQALFSADRTGDLADALADIVGIFTGLWIAKALLR